MIGAEIKSGAGFQTDGAPRRSRDDFSAGIIDDAPVDLDLIFRFPHGKTADPKWQSWRKSAAAKIVLLAAKSRDRAFERIIRSLPLPLFDTLGLRHLATFTQGAFRAQVIEGDRLQNFEIWQAAQFGYDHLGQTLAHSRLPGSHSAGFSFGDTDRRDHFLFRSLSRCAA